MSFGAYIKTCPAGDDPAGHSVRDALYDRDLPDAVTWRQLELYLSRNEAWWIARSRRESGSGWPTRPHSVGVSA